MDMSGQPLTISSLYLLVIILSTHYKLRIDDSIAISYQLDGNFFLRDPTTELRPCISEIFDQQYTDDVVGPAPDHLPSQWNTDINNHSYTVISCVSM